MVSSEWHHLHNLPFTDWVERNLKINGAVGENGPRKEFATHLWQIWR